jgi:diaminohydroxyphosphoribosylaminopyrimidine deaminase/5-amino-6-(5-phosphoribosylamino)uracil reductase
MFSELDHRWMARALELAARGRYTTHPNPRVGCVIAQGDEIVGEGWYEKDGGPHAEPNALRVAGGLARGAAAYVTLEPHCYQGRTPPCTTALIEAGVRRVVAATLDPNPQVSGEGMAQLTRAGVEAQTGLLEAAACELNRGFIKRWTRGLPWVTVKIAASLDGRTALANGESRWITGAAARADVQRLRAQSSAVLTGIGTVLADNPQLNVRDPAIEMCGRQPLRAVCDSAARTPVTAQLLANPNDCLILTRDAESPAARTLLESGAHLCQVATDAGGRLDLGAVLRELARRKCNEVLVEAGPTLCGRLLELGLVDELIVYQAPLLLGPAARPLLDLPLLEQMQERRRLELKDVRQVGEDLRVTMRPLPRAVGLG